MLRTLILAAAVASTLLIADNASARGGRGGCGGGSCGGGGCYSGGCGSRGGSYGGGCGGGGCYTGGGYSGGCASGTCAVGSACPGGVCAVSGAPAMMAAVFGMPASAEARLVVSVPSDATLTVDGQVTTSTSTVRVLRTPALAQGSDYAYTLKAEVVRNGQAQSIVRQVTVRAGQETRVDLTEAGNSVAAAE